MKHAQKQLLEQKYEFIKFAHEKLTLKWNYLYISKPKIKTTK